MSTYGTIIQQGYFAASAAPYTLKLASDVDWLKVYDPTNYAAAAAVGFEYFWQRGMAAGTGVMLYHAAASTVVNSAALAAPLGFTLIDSSQFTVGAPVSVTAGTNATQPLYSAVLTGLSVGSIVRIQNTAQVNLNGLDFSIDTVGAGQFRLANTLATAPGIVAGANGTYRIVASSRADYDMVYPARRVISNITQAVAGTNRVTTLVDHGLSTGQQVRINIPAICGMTQLNGQLVTVTVTSVSQFSIDVDTTGYTAFVFPTAAQAINAIDYAEMIPVGSFALQYSAVPISTTNLNPATTQMNYLGIQLGYDPAGTGLAPAGMNGHTMYWIAGKSLNL